MGKGSLLLVDDDRHVLESMDDWLREQGYDVDAANSYAAAQTAIGRKTYDVVLADISLRDGDGQGAHDRDDRRCRVARARQ